MSADNGIYILRTPKGNGFEYRVANLQCIENYTWDRDHNCESDNPDVHIENARTMWGNCKAFYSQQEALLEADKLLRESYICEYGICSIKIPREFDDNSMPAISAEEIMASIKTVSKVVMEVNEKLSEVSILMENMQTRLRK